MMDTMGSAEKVRVPKLQQQEIVGLRDFWNMYEAQRPEITAQLRG